MNEEKVIETVMENSEEIKNVTENVVNSVVTNSDMFLTGFLSGVGVTSICGLMIYKFGVKPGKIKIRNIFKKNRKEAEIINIDERSEEAENESDTKESKK